MKNLIYLPANLLTIETGPLLIATCMYRLLCEKGYIWEVGAKRFIPMHY